MDHISDKPQPMLCPLSKYNDQIGFGPRFPACSDEGHLDRFHAVNLAITCTCANIVPLVCHVSRAAGSSYAEGTQCMGSCHDSSCTRQQCVGTWNSSSWAQRDCVAFCVTAIIGPVKSGNLGCRTACHSDASGRPCLDAIQGTVAEREQRHCLEISGSRTSASLVPV
jgi:hypothetical protein